MRLSTLLSSSISSFSHCGWSHSRCLLSIITSTILSVIDQSSFSLYRTSQSSPLSVHSSIVQYVMGRIRVLVDSIRYYIQLHRLNKKRKEVELDLSLHFLLESFSLSHVHSGTTPAIDTVNTVIPIPSIDN